MNFPNDPALWAPHPEWLPRAVRLYLDHVVGGLSLRALARREGCNASTVLRLVRRYEGRRDDLLLDQALTELAEVSRRPHSPDFPLLHDPDKDPAMTVPFRPVDEATLQREGRRVLRRLTEPGAFLAIAPDMEKAAVMRAIGGAQPVTTTTMERRVAQAFALKDWIACTRPGRISRYEVTQAGRSALRRMVEAEEGARPGLAEAQSPFAAQHRVMEEREFHDADGRRKARVNLTESPVQVLGRRRDKTGQPFLSADLVGAAERLREDFELAQMGPRVAQNWERFLTPVDGGGPQPGPGGVTGSGTARDRVALALRELGPGLGDMVLRCCCFLEGLEIAEQRLGWSARSGKIVLRIALMRLARHYLETYGRFGPKIG